MRERICLITAGGHISSFHAAMKKMHETLEKNAPGRFNLVGANGGLEGLVKYGVIPIKYDANQKVKRQKELYLKPDINISIDEDLRRFKNDLKR